MIRVICSLWALIFVVITVPCANAAEAVDRYGLSQDERSGYLEIVGSERYELVTEMVLVSGPPPKKNYQRLIFAPKLKREFSERYTRQFGRTDIDRNIDQGNRFAEAEYSPGLTVTLEEDRQRKREFGEYMLRRLGEYHFDNYIKNSPNARTIYEIKEQVSNAKIRLNKGYKVKVNYNYSANAVGLEVTNPLKIMNRVTLQMDPNSVGPGDIKETTLTVGYLLPRGYFVRSDYELDEKQVVLVASKRLQPGLTGSISSRNYFGSEEESASRDRRVLLGLTWTH